MVHARQNSFFKDTSKWMMISGLLILTLTIVSGCSFEKNSGENQAKTPDVIVVEAPPKEVSGAVVLAEDIVTKIEPLEFGKYQVEFSFREEKEAAVRLKYVSHVEVSGIETLPIMVSQGNGYRTVCKSGEKIQFQFDVYTRSGLPNQVFQKSVSCPTDLRVLKHLNEAEASALSSVTGRLYIANGVVIKNGRDQLWLRAKSIKLDGDVTIITTRYREVRDDGTRFPRDLNEKMYRGSGEDCPRRHGVSLARVSSFGGFRQPHGSIRFCSDNREFDLESGLQVLYRNDREKPNVLIQSDFVSGLLRVVLIGADGADGVSGDDIGRLDAYYQNLLYLNTPEQGKAGENGMTLYINKSRFCHKPNGNGGVGAPGIIPGLDGGRGEDGMPSASLKIDIKNSEMLTLQVKCGLVLVVAVEHAVRASLVAWAARQERIWSVTVSVPWHNLGNEEILPHQVRLVRLAGAVHAGSSPLVSC